MEPLMMELARFEAEWHRGDRNRARQLAVEYIDAYEAALAPLLAEYDLPGLVRLVETYRASGQENNRVLTEMWILARCEPQRIVGQLDIRREQMAQALLDAAR